MFKIPSYGDLEKKEKESNAKVNELKLSLFKKQQSLPQEKSENILQPTVIEKPASKTVEQNKNDDDDDALLLEIDLDSITSAVSASKQYSSSLLPDESAKAVTSKDMQNKSSDNSSNTAVFKKPTVTKLVPPVSNSTSNSTSNLIVNAKQRGNPILKHIRNVQWAYSDTLTPDFCMSRTSCALYLSMKYHLLNNEYIHDRLRDLGRAYELRVLLVQCDIKEPKHCLKELEKICLLANLTLILCWNHEEAGRYLETYKAYEYKNADLIKEKSTATSANTANASASDINFMAHYTEFVCAIKGVNKTDASTLRQTFGSIKQLSQAKKHELTLCPGLGPLKVNRLYDIFRTPFLLNSKESVNQNT